ncbi:MAG: amidohydrolase family protein [Bacteroidetes bacterium]|nr:amidohydrolase family protein [Bacteroidota bacterium]
MTTGELPSGIRKYEGFICPGFVNMHCHLELSHLKGKFAEKTGLVGFIDQMRLRRGGEFIHESILKADQEMFANGIVAVADISNSPDTIDIKRSRNSTIIHLSKSLMLIREERKKFLKKD